MDFDAFAWMINQGKDQKAQNWSKVGELDQNEILGFRQLDVISSEIQELMDEVKAKVDLLNSMRYTFWKGIKTRLATGSGDLYICEDRKTVELDLNSRD